MSLAKDLEYGLQKENEVMNVLSKAFDVELIKTSKYASIDFKSDSVDIELKSRTNAHDTYMTTMIPKSKIDYIKKYGGDKRFIFAFNFTDGLYYIEYNSEFFDKFEFKMFVRNKRIDYNDKEQMYCFIPTSKLIKI
jgi:hypothetical protein